MAKTNQHGYKEPDDEAKAAQALQILKDVAKHMNRHGNKMGKLISARDAKKIGKANNCEPHEVRFSHPWYQHKYELYPDFLPPITQIHLHRLADGDLYKLDETVDPKFCPHGILRGYEDTKKRGTLTRIRPILTENHAASILATPQYSKKNARECNEELSLIYFSQTEESLRRLIITRQEKELGILAAAADRAAPADGAAAANVGPPAVADVPEAIGQKPDGLTNTQRKEEVQKLEDRQDKALEIMLEHNSMYKTAEAIDQQVLQGVDFDTEAREKEMQRREEARVRDTQARDQDFQINEAARAKAQQTREEILARTGKVYKYVEKCAPVLNEILADRRVTFAVGANAQRAQQNQHEAPAAEATNNPDDGAPAPPRGAEEGEKAPPAPRGAEEPKEGDNAPPAPREAGKANEGDEAPGVADLENMPEARKEPPVAIPPPPPSTPPAKRPALEEPASRRSTRKNKGKKSLKSYAEEREDPTVAAAGDKDKKLPAVVTLQPIITGQQKELENLAAAAEREDVTLLPMKRKAAPVADGKLTEEEGADKKPGAVDKGRGEVTTVAAAAETNKREDATVAGKHSPEQAGTQRQQRKNWMAEANKFRAEAVQELAEMRARMRDISDTLQGIEARMDCIEARMEG